MKEKELLVGDCLLAATFISYIGPFTKQYREELMETILIPLVIAPPQGAAIPMTPDMETIGLILMALVGSAFTLTVAFYACFPTEKSWKAAIGQFQSMAKKD